MDKFIYIYIYINLYGFLDSLKSEICILCWLVCVCEHIQTYHTETKVLTYSSIHKPKTTYNVWFVIKICLIPNMTNTHKYTIISNNLKQLITIKSDKILYILKIL